jgi:hypothetical protein
VLFFCELVLFGVSETAYNEKSPTENMFGKIASLLRFFGKFSIPKQGRPFLLTMLYPTIRKRDSCTPAILTGLKHSPDEFFSPGLECRKDAVGMVLADIGKPHPKTGSRWHPSRTEQTLDLLPWLFSPGVFSSLQKIITSHMLLPGPVQ